MKVNTKLEPKAAKTDEELCLDQAQSRYEHLLHMAPSSSFRGRNAFLALFCVCYFIDATSLTYLIVTLNSIMSTLEISHLQAGLLFSLRDVGYVLTLILLSICGNGGNRVFWLWFGGLFETIGNLACALVVIASLSPGASPTEQRFYTLIALGNVLIGSGHSILWSIGIPIMEESSFFDRTPLYVGSLFLLKMFGTTFGFVLGSVWAERDVIVTGLTGNVSWAFPVPVQSSDKSDLADGDVRFAGWPIGFLFASLFFFLFSTPMVYFWQRPFTKAVPKIRVRRMTSIYAENNRRYASAFSRYCVAPVDAVKNVISSPAYILCMAGRACDVFSFKGQLVFTPTFLRLEYGVDLERSGLTLGPIGGVGFTVGTCIGLMVVKKLKASMGKIALWLSFCSAACCIFSSFSIFLSCEGLSISPLSTVDGSRNYTSWFGGLHPSSEQCNSVSISLYLFCAGALALATGCSAVPAVLLVLCSVPVHRRSVGIGLSAFIVSAFGTLPATAVMGFLIDSTMPDPTNTTAGDIESGRDRFRFWFHAVSAFLRLLASLSDLYVWFRISGSHRKVEHPTKSAEHDSDEDGVEEHMCKHSF